MQGTPPPGVTLWLTPSGVVIVIVPPSKAQGVPMFDLPIVIWYVIVSHSDGEFPSRSEPSARNASNLKSTAVPEQAGGSWCAAAGRAPLRTSAPIIDTTSGA